MLSRIALESARIEVSRLCLGAGDFGTRLRGDAVRRLAGDFLEAGGDFFDTAHVYAFWVPGGLGASERELGACLRDLGCTDTVTIATKGGHPDAGPDYRRPDTYLSEQAIFADIAESRDRLGVESIDLYFLHRDDMRVPVGEIVDLTNAAILAGSIRAWGVSNWSTHRIAAANAYATEHGLHGIVASQVQWSLATPDWTPGPDPVMRFVAEADAAWYAETGVPVVCYSATANGFFAGRGQHSGAYASPANRARLERARELAASLGCTPTRVALAYLLHQPARTVALFSTTSCEHLAEAIGADSVILTAEQVAYLHNG